MILPERCSIMTLLASWASSKAAVRLTDTMGSHWSRPKSCTSDSRVMPAEFTRMSTEPSVSTQRCTMAAGTPGCVMSAVTNSIRRPAPSISRRVVPSSSARPTANTSAPAVASAREKALPRPVLPPVTRALRPTRENRSRLKSAMSISQATTTASSPGHRRSSARYLLLTIRRVAMLTIFGHPVVTAGRAVPRLRGEREQGGRDGGPALLAEPEAPGRQPAERVLGIGQPAARGDRGPQRLPQAPGGGTVAVVPVGRRRIVVGQRQLDELLEPHLPPGLEQGPPVRQRRGFGHVQGHRWSPSCAPGHPRGRPFRKPAAHESPLPPL